MPDVQVLTARAHRLLAPVIQEIGELNAKGEPCILLVPEQLTLQMERELLNRLDLQGTFTIQVLSPSRLSERVLAAAGVDERKPLDASGRRMAISQALERCESRLSYYRSSAHRRGFVEKLSALLTDMKRGNLTPESLGEYAEASEDGREKMKDLAIIYEAYESILRARFSDEEDQFRYVASRLLKSGLLTGEFVFVYGFDALPQQLTGLLSAMAPLCQRLTVALVSDGESGLDGEIYLPVRQGIGRFAKSLEAQGISLGQRAIPFAPLAAAPAMQHLDKALYAYPPVAFEQPQENIFLSVHQSPFEEAGIVARHILRLCEEGVDIERIAVLYPDQNGYPLAVATALSDAGLPFYTDQKLPAISHGLIRFLLCALRAVADGYRNEDVFGMLKSGYSPLTFEEGCRLENYAISYGIDRSRWTKPFAKGNENLVALCEALRCRLMKPLVRLREGIVAAKDTQASLSAVFGLLEEIRAYETLKTEEEALLWEGLAVRAGQNSQVWQTLLRLLEQLHALSGGARIPLKHIAGRLECGFSAVSLASLPPASRMLHAGTLGHYLSGEMECVFILGLNDGVLTRSADSLFSEDERAEVQQETGSFLGLTDESRSLLAKLDLKRAMTLPSRLLFLSCAKTGPEGAALRPLPLLKVLREGLFSELAQSPVSPSELPFSAAQALAELSVRLRAYADGTGESDNLPENWREILRKLLENPHTAKKTMGLLRAADYRLESVPIPRAKAARLFGEETLSVSRLEMFAQCPFKHFVTYGLRPQVIKEWKVEPLDTGNFYHESLYRFAELSKGEANYPHIGTDQVDAMADAAIEPLLAELMQGPMGDGARSLALFQQARQTVKRAALTVTRHLAAGQFRVFQAEATFGYPGGMPPIALSLPDGRQVLLRGKIDRVDRYDAGESVYLRVIDYKSGRQELDAAKTWWGLQLQLLLYLDACVAAQPGALPAGAFYFYVSDPLVKSDSDMQAVVEDKLRELLQLRGIALSDVEILRAMDGADQPTALPKMLDQSGEILSRAKALEMPEFQALLVHARQVATNLAEGIFSGETSAAPTVSRDQAACDFCGFRDICGFYPEIPGAAYRSVPGMTLDDLRNRLSEREE